jgi:hypothetical protein
MILLEGSGEDDRVKQSIGLSEGLLIVEIVPFLHQLLLHLVEEILLLAKIHSLHALESFLDELG